MIFKSERKLINSFIPLISGANVIILILATFNSLIINSLDGVKRNNSDIETGSVELVVDYSEFSIDELRTSFDKSGWSYENASIEDVY